jgi:hypothetical protein
MIGVTWTNKDERLASARLRSLIPRKVLTDRGLIGEGRDVVVCAKHGWDALMVRDAFPRMIMDICDDHFSDKSKGYHYRGACRLADLVTCNSTVMKQLIKEQTGKDAIIIDDPYEDEELTPKAGNGVLWFGHTSNQYDLEAIRHLIRHPLKVINNVNYSPEALDAALKACRCVVIPTGKSLAKSANRAIRAIRYGKYPVCGRMPAHAELGLGEEDVIAALDRAMSQDMTPTILEFTLELQKRVRERFSPQRVADDWYEVISGV